MDKKEQMVNRLLNIKPIAAVALIAGIIIGTGSLISSISEIRHFVIGEHILLKDISQVKFSELSPELIRKNVREPAKFNGKNVTWKAAIYEEQSPLSDHKIKVISDDTVIDLHVKEPQVLKLLHQLKVGSKIIFTGTVNDRPRDADLDIDLQEIFWAT